MQKEPVSVPKDMEMLDYIVSFVEMQETDNSSENHYEILKDEKTYRKIKEEINQRNPKPGGTNLILDWSYNHRNIQMVISLNNSKMGNKTAMFIHQISIDNVLIFQCRRFGSKNTFLFQV